MKTSVQQTQEAAMERGKKLNGKTLGLLAVAGFGIWFLMRKPPGAAAQGLARFGPSGHISGIRLGGARMGTHQIAKLPGALVDISFTWTGTTKDFNGVGISWLYRYRVFFVNSATSEFIGPGLVGPTTSAMFNTPQPSGSVQITIPTGTPTNTVIDVLVKLEAQASDANGLPVAPAVWVDLFDAVHDNAILVGGTTTGAATPSGSIGAVEVAQGR